MGGEPGMNLLKPVPGCEEAGDPADETCPPPARGEEKGAPSRQLPQWEGGEDASP